MGGGGGQKIILEKWKGQNIIYIGKFTHPWLFQVVSMACGTDLLKDEAIKKEMATIDDADEEGHSDLEMKEEDLSEDMFMNDAKEFTFLDSVCAVITYSCDQCDYTATKMPTLKTHMRSKHEGVRYPCDQCEYSATENGNLKKHKKFKHEGVKYPCDQCEYSATVLSSLKRHQGFKHAGIRYPCSECDYAATTQSSLKRHNEYKHVGVKYLCDQCHYAATTPSSLKRHQDSKHEGKGHIN